MITGAANTIAAAVNAQNTHFRARRRALPVPICLELINRTATRLALVGLGTLRMEELVSNVDNLRT